MTLTFIDREGRRRKQISTIIHNFFFFGFLFINSTANRVVSPVEVAAIEHRFIICIVHNH